MGGAYNGEQMWVGHGWGIIRCGYRIWNKVGGAYDGVTDVG